MNTYIKVNEILRVHHSHTTVKIDHKTMDKQLTIYGRMLTTPTILILQQVTSNKREE